MKTLTYLVILILCVAYIAFGLGKDYQQSHSQVTVKDITELTTLANQNEDTKSLVNTLLTKNPTPDKSELSEMTEKVNKILVLQAVSNETQTPSLVEQTLQKEKFNEDVNTFIFRILGAILLPLLLMWAWRIAKRPEY